MAARARRRNDRRQSDDARLSNPDWAWSVYEPDAQRPWNLVKAGHLYRRAAFAADYGQLQQALGDGPQKAIDKLLNPAGDIDEFNSRFDAFDESAGGSIETLRAWWLRRMIETPHPLLEKMALLWHNHFATSIVVSKDAKLMLKNLRLLRSQALGSFKPMLQGMSKDPAMLLWLGAEANRKASPNNNFAAAMMRQFTVGADNCTDHDITEAARACTGWFVLRGQIRYIEREHDTTEKTILGETGAFDIDDVIRILLANPATARTIVRKMYRWLISESDDPAEALIDPLAKSFARDYDITKLAETMLRSNIFFSSSAYRRRVKCPVEYALSIVKALEASVSTTELAKHIADLGQSLFAPTTVDGWAGGSYWIDSAAMTARSNLAKALLDAGDGPYKGKVNLRAIAEKHGAANTEAAAKFLLDLLLQGDLDSGVARAIMKAPASEDGEDSKLRQIAHALLTVGEFNLA